MKYAEFKSKPPEERAEIIDEIESVRENSFLFPIVYGFLHKEHKEYHFKFHNKALAQKVSAMLFDERLTIVKQIVN